MRSAVVALDHLVLATPDLAATTAWLTQATGVVPSAGGAHVGKGTRNMLCSLGQTSYLEIVGPDLDQDDPPAARPFGIDALLKPELVGWAIAVPDMRAALATARSRGYDPGEAAAMQRRRPDGIVLSWQLTISPSRTMPFLIDWGGSPHPAPHAASGLELVDLRACHPEPGMLAMKLAALGVTMGIEHGGEALLVQLHGPIGMLDFD